MEDTPPLRVSALLVSRNQRDALQRTLQSLEASDIRQELEIVSVDNGSSDGSADLDRDFPGVHFLRLPKNFGFTKAANIGIRTAKADFLFFLPAGAVVGPETVRLLAAALEATPQAAAVIPRAQTSYLLPDRQRLWVAFTTGEYPDPRVLNPAEGPVKVEYPRGAPMMIRRTNLAGMNFLDGGFGEAWWDAEVCWQLLRAGKGIWMIPEAAMEWPDHGKAAPGDVPASADMATGAARYLSKRSGFVSGLQFKLSAAFHAFGKAITFRDSAYNLKRFGAILSGQKLDGNQ